MIGQCGSFGLAWGSEPARPPLCPRGTLGGAAPSVPAPAGEWAASGVSQHPRRTAQLLPGGRTWPPGLSCVSECRVRLSLPRKQRKLFTGSSISHASSVREDLFSVTRLRKALGLRAAAQPGWARVRVGRLLVLPRGPWGGQCLGSMASHWRDVVPFQPQTCCSSRPQ